MALLSDLAKQHTDLGAAERAHLRRLIGSWGPLSDLSFADLLLFAPVADHSDLDPNGFEVDRSHRPEADRLDRAEADRLLDRPKADGSHRPEADRLVDRPEADRSHRPNADRLVDRPEADRLVVLAQMRPATAQTLYLDDQLGRLVDRGDRPLVELAFESGDIHEKELDLKLLGRRIRITAIPVRFQGSVIAVVTRETRQSDDASQSELELAYLDVFDRLARMMADGNFPFPFEDAVTEESPRVGDGALVLEAGTRVVYSSPNAVSALHRAGYHGRIVDRRLEDLGFDGAVVASAYRLQVPVIEELERGENVTIMTRILPLIEDGEVTGALVLLRDVSDLRRRDRMLVSMDATIKEIHHRVKNNLQTVSSLLRIQGRRLENPEAKSAIDESVRRIQSIATIHEMLANSGGDEVVFTEVVEPIMKMAESTLVASDRPIKFHLVGDGPTLSASKASSLAVVVTELLQNSIEHGFPVGTDGGSVTVELVTSPTELRVRVHDDGVGVSEEFDARNASGLGLTIISTLVSGELNGELRIRPATAPQRGTLAEVRVQIGDDDD